MSIKILVAGATGNLGGKIIDALVERKANVYALVRLNAATEKVNVLKEKGVTVFQVDTGDRKEVAKACAGMGCVISALSGLEDVIIDLQKILFDAAVEAKVPRFIPSDYCLDFTNLIPGKNRNLDLRREFHRYIENTPVAVTTIFNGAFMDLLTGEMPLILFKIRRILYWGSQEQSMDFTTTHNVAAFTANTAMDEHTPRYLSIAGDSISSKQLGVVLSEITGQKFSTLKAGNLGLLEMIIKIARLIAPGKQVLYPAWQGMQYMRDMLEGRAAIAAYDNRRYGSIHWTSVKEFLISQNVVEKYRT